MHARLPAAAAALPLGLALLLLLALPLRGQAPERSGPFDLLITDARVYDGTGNPWFRADVGVRDGVIAAIGDLSGASAARTLAAGGRALAPGFIDLHSHADRQLTHEDARRRAAPNLVMQGITTLLVNQDGRSPWPLAPQREELERLGFGPNTILMIGHGQLRREVLEGSLQRPATPAEVDAMRGLVRQGMAEGAWGLSAALEYNPGRYARTDEVAALVEEIVPYGGVYISHQRSEGSDPMWYWPSRHEPGPPTLLDAVRETIEIGERTGAPVVASHIKAKGAHYFGSSHAAIHLIEQARARGVQVYADQYPYVTSGSDGSTVLIPGWAFSAGRELQDDDDLDLADALRAVLDDDALAADLRRDVEHEISRRGGADQVVVFDHPERAVVGRSLAELAAERGISPVEMAFRLQLEGDPRRRGGARLRGFSMSEIDLEAYAPRPWVATASDAGIALPGDGPVHARFYGTFPRKIHRYALERGVIGVEDAIRSATSLPAQILGMRDRGQVRAGYRADLVLLDLDRLRDQATFFEPHQYPDGVDYVLVGGTFVVEGGEPTWALPGRILTPQTDR